MSILRASNTSAHHCTEHTNSTSIQLRNKHVFACRCLRVADRQYVCDRKSRQKGSTVCHSPCCKCIFSSETCCSCVAVDNGSLPCFSSQRSLFNPPTHCLTILLSAFIYLHLTLITQTFVHTMSIWDVRFGSAPAEAQSEPQRGHRRDTRGGPAGCLGSDEPANMWIVRMMPALNWVRMWGLCVCKSVWLICAGRWVCESSATALMSVLPSAGEQKRQNWVLKPSTTEQWSNLHI